MALPNYHSHSACISGYPNFCHYSPPLPISLMSLATHGPHKTITLRKHSSHSFPMTPLVQYVSFLSSISPKGLLRVDLSEKQTNKQTKVCFCVFTLTWMKYTRAEAVTAWACITMGAEPLLQDHGLDVCCLLSMLCARSDFRT